MDSASSKTLKSWNSRQVFFERIARPMRTADNFFWMDSPSHVKGWRFFLTGSSSHLNSIPVRANGWRTASRKERFRVRGHIYHKILIISPGLIFVHKAVLLGLFSGSLFLEGLKHYENSLKQCKRIWDCLLSEGFLRLRFRGLIFRRAFFFGRGGVMRILR